MTSQTNRSRRRFTLGAMALAASMPFASFASSDWPNGPVKIVVPFAAGGNTDTIARLMAERLADKFDVPFVVENRGGAGGQIASEYVARAKPDGQTLYMATMTQIVTAPMTNKVRYDPVKDFEPIVNIGGNPFILAVNRRHGFKTVGDFVEYGKENPDALNVGHAGVGALTHLSALLFLSRAGLDATMIPYRGGAQALVDVVAGEVDMYSASPSEVLQYAETGDVTLLAVSSPERLPQVPDLPTIAEDYPDHVVETWNGLLGPAGMSDAVVDALSKAGSEIVAEEQFQKKLIDIGIVPYGEQRDVFAKRIQSEIATWGPVIKDAGIEPQ